MRLERLLSGVVWQGDRSWVGRAVPCPGRVRVGVNVCGVRRARCPAAVILKSRCVSCAAASELTGSIGVALKWLALAC